MLNSGKKLFFGQPIPYLPFNNYWWTFVGPIMMWSILLAIWFIAWKWTIAENGLLKEKKFKMFGDFFFFGVSCLVSKIRPIISTVIPSWHSLSAQQVMWWNIVFLKIWWMMWIATLYFLKISWMAWIHAQANLS